MSWCRGRSPRRKVPYFQVDCNAWRNLLVSAASGRLRTTEFHSFNGACACQAHCRAREENLAACAAEVLLKLNMTIGRPRSIARWLPVIPIWIHCAEPWFRSRGASRLRIMSDYGVPPRVGAGFRFALKAVRDVSGRE